MGPPPRSLAAEANGCFMVRVRHGPNRIQGCGARDAPDSGLPSDQSKHASTTGEQSHAIKLDTDVPIQGCAKTRRAIPYRRAELRLLRFFLTRRGHRPRKLGTRRTFSQFSHTLGGFRTYSRRPGGAGVAPEA